MTVFESYEPNVYVLGANIFSIVDGMGAFKQKAYDILKSCGIMDPKPDQWYSMQQWLNAFKIIREKLGDATLKVIGSKIPETARLPPQINSVESFLPMLDQAYHMNHRGGEIGHYKFEKTGNKEGILKCNNPYPCAFDYGLIQGFVEKFRESGTIPLVQHDPGTCRMEGSNVCNYHIKW